jgi:hypothetical protein
MTWKSFSEELVERFDDPSRKMKAQNQIHAFVQDKSMTVQTYIDKFAILKATSGISDEEALFLFRRGIGAHISLAIYNTQKAPPDNYADFVSLVKDIGKNMENRKGILEGARTLTGLYPSRPAPRQSMLDRRTGTGLTYGGSGQPMEIGLTRPMKCYNCNKNGHMAKECKEPKREKGACFYCAKLGHQAKDCRKKKADREKSMKVKKFEPEDNVEEENINQADEVPEEEMVDFIEGSD